MSGRRLRLVLLAIVAVVQLATPLSMIARRERVLEHGELFRFRAEPVDPADAFRGRFVALSFAEQSVPLALGGGVGPGERVYARLERDADGFARIAALERDRPQTGDYFSTRVRWRTEDELVLELPFDRYYLEEELAPLAERAYGQFSRGEVQRVWAEVRVDDGFAVLQELYLAGQPVRLYLESRLQG